MQRFPDGVTLEAGPGGLERLTIATPDARCALFTHGAHVAHFQREGGAPVLWMSRRSRFAPGHPIRGGVPICFPWFGVHAADAQAPRHGFARLVPWSIGAVVADADGRIRVTLNLPASAETRRFFPHEFSATFRVTVGAALEMELTVRNLGSTPFRFEEALHSYFAVSDVRQIVLAGLENAEYLDEAAALARKRDEASALRIEAETDRTYFANDATVTLSDPGRRRRILIRKTGSATTVVWNPWVAKAQAMPDFGDDEWPEMICIETANSRGDAVGLAPGADHVLRAIIEVQPD